MTSLQNNGKTLTSAEPSKLYIIRHRVKSYGYFCCQILAPFTMPTHQILSLSRDPKCKLSSCLFYFVQILCFILGKVIKFLVEKLSTSEVIS